MRLSSGGNTWTEKDMRDLGKDYSLIDIQIVLGMIYRELIRETDSAQRDTPRGFQKMLSKDLDVEPNDRMPMSID